MPNPIYSRIIVGPAVGGKFDDLKGWKIVVFVLRLKVVFALYNEKQRHHKAIATDIFDRCRPFSITRLQLLVSSAAVGIYNNHCSVDNAHYKAGLVEVVKVGILDAILRPYVLHQLEPLPNKVRVLAEGPLEVVGARKTRL